MGLSPRPNYGKRAREGSSAGSVCIEHSILPIALARAIPGNIELATRQFLRALRGRRSQRAFAKRLGYRANPITDWEHRSEEHTSELQSQSNLVCRLLLEKKKTTSQ